MNVLRTILRLSSVRGCLCAGFLLSGTFFCLCVQADIVTLKDKTTLRCEVVDKNQTADTKAKYLEIRIGQSVIWLDRAAVERIESTTESVASSPEIDALVKRLMEQGILVSTIKEKEKVDSEPPSTPSREQDITIRVKEIRGWAYAYENEKAIEEGLRTPIDKDGAIPLGFILKVSPNTRLTLDLPTIGDMGLEAGTVVRFDKVVKNRSLRSNSMSFRIDKGRCWLNIRSQERLILSINSVSCVPQNALLYVETTIKTGAIDVTFLKGDNNLKFSRNRVSEAPYELNQGQVLRVDPGTNTLPVEESLQAAVLQRRIDTWNNWQMESLALGLEAIVPPLITFPSFRALPVLHPYKLTIDQALMMSPETRSMGEIFTVYHQALEKYRIDTGHYPTFDQGLDALSKSFDVPGWKGPYIPLEFPRRDAWGTPYVYDLYTDKGRPYADVRSNGQNGKDDKGLGDDIR